jgi:hypothetical protein
MGCVHTNKPYNPPSQEKLRVQSQTPEQYIIRVADQIDYLVSPDGGVLVNIPRLERGCATHLFGLLQIIDSSPYNVQAIQVRKGERIIRKLSLNDLAELPIDGAGYHLVKVE